MLKISKRATGNDHVFRRTGEFYKTDLGTLLAGRIMLRTSVLRPTANFHIYTRTMSTSSTSPNLKKHKFVVYAPDSTDPGTLARRYEVRERHLEAARQWYIRYCPVSFVRVEMSDREVS
jgi:hypothetical protein